MSKIAVHAKVRIHDGKLEDFKEIAHACVSAVRQKDPGTIQYDWFLSADGKTCVIREEYEDSASLLAHFGTVGSLLEKLMEAASVELELFGEPDEQLEKALASVPHKSYSTLIVL